MILAAAKRAKMNLLHRLHATLMPDYNRAAATFWWGLVLVGAAVIAVAIHQAWLRPLPVQLQVLAVCLASMLAGAFPVPLPGTKSSFSAAEIFIFLGLLYIGLDVACLAAAAEALVASSRTSKRWTSRLVSPAVAALSIGIAGWAFLRLTALLDAHGLYAQGTLLTLLPAAAIAYFLLTGWLLRMVLHLKTEKPLRLDALLGDFGWIGSTYAANAFLAGLLYLTARHAGEIVLLAAGPMVALLLMTVHFHFRQRQAEAAEAEARVESAERQAAQAARHNAELRRIASEQGTSALFDHQHFLDSLADTLARESSIRRNHAVLYASFEHFKRIEATLGPAAGEEFLVHAGNRIQRRLRHCDLVGKLGGDEFAMLVMDVSRDQACDLAKRLLDALSLPYAVGGVTVENSVSLGVALSGHGYAGPQEMLRAAEAAMCQAITQGGRRYVVHQPDVLQPTEGPEKIPVLNA
jgi:diguanylate cyclase (GGDEF)-like protein